MNEIEKFINLMREKKEILIRNSYIDIQLNTFKKKNIQNQSKHRDDNLYEYSQISSTYEDLVEHLNQKKNNKIIILSSNEDFGIVSFFLGKWGDRRGVSIPSWNKHRARPYP